jgi:hypothetical protein
MKCLICQNSELESAPGWTRSYFCGFCGKDDRNDYNFYFSNDYGFMAINIDNYRLIYYYKNPSYSYFIIRKEDCSFDRININYFPANMHLTHSLDQIKNIIDQHLVFS